MLAAELVLQGGDGAVLGVGVDLAALVGNGRIATGDVRAVPAGLYAKAALEKLGVWSSVESKLTMAENVRAALVLVREPLHRPRRIHRRVPTHVGHEQHQRVDAIRIACPCVADHRMQHAVRGERIGPREGVIDTQRTAVFVDEQIVGRMDESERRGIQRAIRLPCLARTVR